jgi:hypothetical protein
MFVWCDTRREIFWRCRMMIFLISFKSSRLNLVKWLWRQGIEWFVLTTSAVSRDSDYYYYTESHCVNLGTCIYAEGRGWKVKTRKKSCTSRWEGSPPRQMRLQKITWTTAEHIIIAKMTRNVTIVELLKGSPFPLCRSVINSGRLSHFCLPSPARQDKQWNKAAAAAAAIPPRGWAVLCGCRNFCRK